VGKVWYSSAPQYGPQRMNLFATTIKTYGPSSELTIITRLVFVFVCAVMLSGCLGNGANQNLVEANAYKTERKTKNFTVGISLKPTYALNNKLHIDLKNDVGQPVTDAKVLVSVKRIMMDTPNLAPKSSAAGVYTFDTNMAEGKSDLEIVISSGDKSDTIQMEAYISPQLPPNAIQ